MGKKYKDKDKFTKEIQQISPEPQVRKKFHIKDLLPLVPLTPTQHKYVNSYRETPEKHFFLGGPAGCGKSYLSLRLAIEDVLLKKYEKIIIVRSAVQTREIGFTTGDADEKLSVYEVPYHGIFDSFFTFKKSYENLKLCGQLEFTSSSFLRSQTWDNAIIFVDEGQSMNFHELDTIITRTSDTSKIIFAGDLKAQNDLNKSKYDTSGFVQFAQIIKSMGNHFEMINFEHDDIVRGKMMKDYIIKKDLLF